MKDLFSKIALQYSKFRPTYPESLFQYLSSLTKEHAICWDIGCGNGQAARSLAAYYKEVIATDPSASQLANAKPHPNIKYHVLAAEEPSPLIPNQSVDLIAVATAYHWFHHDEFFKRVKQVAKPDGSTVLACWTYSLNELATPELNSLLDHFYHNIIGNYWEPERRYVDMRYDSIPWPDFVTPLDEQGQPLPKHPRKVNRNFSIVRMSTFDDYLGYLTSWSGTREYTEKHQGKTPFDIEKGWLQQFKEAWDKSASLDGEQKVLLNLNLLVGRVD